MTDQHPAERPGHLDIDAVSAYVDRDFGADDLATIERHLRECPPCQREVLEIAATVMLLSALPQYAPSRSFCLGVEHARRAHQAARGGAWSGGAAPVWNVPPGSSGAPGGGRFGAWLPGLQTVAVAVGAMLLLVTMGDMLGMTATTGQQFAAPGAVATLQADVAVENPPAPAPASDVGDEADVVLESAPVAPTSEPAAFVQSAPAEGDGTNAVDSASEQVPEDDAVDPAASSGASSSVVALLTPVAGVARESPAERASGTNGQATTGSARPSDLRLIQIVLAVILGWLIVTIIGLRRVRALS
jgi:anti-sigma factor RsiW